MAASICALSAMPALAQTGAAGSQAAANQLGLLEYCKDKGAIGDDAVAAGKSNNARIPGGAVDPAAEATGKGGTLLMNGTKTTLASMASQQGISVDALCKKLGSSALQVAAAFKGSGTGMPGMGGMPSMPNMPSMQGMPNMPNIPGMPAMPATPTR